MPVVVTGVFVFYWPAFRSFISNRYVAHSYSNERLILRRFNHVQLIKDGIMATWFA